MIPDDQVEEVRARADIVGVIGEVVPLRKAGREYKGLCPFHDDRNPSFCVIPEKGFYIRMSCRETGDVFSFVMKRLGLNFVEAVRHVAARSGVEIREVSGTQPEEDPNGPLYELNALARHCTEQEDNAAKVERQVRKSAAALLLRSRIGERFDAIVTGASDKGTWVRIFAPAVEGKVVRGFEGLDVGDRLRVELVHTDVERGFIDFVRMREAR